MPCFNVGYDTLQLNLDHIDRGGLLRCQDVNQVLQSIRPDGTSTSICRLRCLSIKIYPRTVKIWGSFAKYKFGHNLKLLSADELRDVLDEISTRLCIDLRWAKVRRLDYALTAEMNRTPAGYLHHFFPTSKYRLDRSQETSIYIQNRDGSKSLHIYDKTAETSVSPKPSGFLLRLESRLKGPVNRLAGVSENHVLAEDLVCDAFEGTVKQKLLQALEKCLVGYGDCADFERIKRPSDLYDFALERILRDQSLRETLLRTVDQRHQNGDIGRNAASRLKLILRGKKDQECNALDPNMLELLELMTEVRKSTVSRSISSIMYHAQNVSMKSPDSLAQFATAFCESLKDSSPSTAMQMMDDPSDRASLLLWRKTVINLFDFKRSSVIELDGKWSINLHATEFGSNSESKSSSLEVVVGDNDGQAKVLSLTPLNINEN